MAAFLAVATIEENFKVSLSSWPFLVVLLYPTHHSGTYQPFSRPHCLCCVSPYSDFQLCNLEPTNCLHSSRSRSIVNTKAPNPLWLWKPGNSSDCQLVIGKRNDFVFKTPIPHQISPMREPQCTGSVWSQTNSTYQHRVGGGFRRVLCGALGRSKMTF